ncbi:MAG: RsmE family RNA methyltransferase [Treponema sp.]
MKQFIAECEPDPSGRLVLTGDAYNYLIKVRRMQPGDYLPVVLPKSGKVPMLIEKTDTVRQELRLITRPAAAPQSQNIPHPEITLLQWVLKGTKTDTVVRQATEIGVQRIMLVSGEFSIAKKQNPIQLERYRRIIKEARQQSGSPVDTIIAAPAPLNSVLENLAVILKEKTAVLGMCSESAGSSIGLHQLLSPKPEHIVLAIGAEGGISPAEAVLLRSTGFQTIHFNTNVLRAETAALYATAAVHTIINEAEQWQLPE